MSYAINPVEFAGFVLIAVAVTMLCGEVFLRWFKRSGLSQGATFRRKGETASEHQRRSLAYDASEIEWLRRRRPLSLVALLLGVALVVVGIAI